MEATVTEIPQEPAEIYRWSAWLHVGPGAEACDERETGECSNPTHFHAWCRLPNPYQHRDIREIALAARARLMRRLRDSESDAGAILDEEIEQLHRLASRSSEDSDQVRRDLVEDLVARDWVTDYQEAIADAAESEDDRGEKPYEYIERDQDRYRQLQATPEDERPPEQLAELEKHLTAYGEKIGELVRQRQDPRREAFMAKDLNDLLDMVREERIKAAADEEFDHVYATHSWLMCTARKERGARWYTELDQLADAAPEVIGALKETYNDLELSRRKGASGKS